MSHTGKEMAIYKELALVKGKNYLLTKEPLLFPNSEKRPVSCILVLLFPDV